MRAWSRGAIAACLVATAVVLALRGRGDERTRSDGPHLDAPAEWQVPELAPPDAAPVDAAPAGASPERAPDPVERGACALFLLVIDAATGSPVATTVDLWRLDAPGNEAWTAGDQLQLTAEVPPEGATFPDLPAGTYRPVCLAERSAADDPPPVRVQGPRTEVEIRIALPRKLRAFVKVVDLRGEPVARGVVRSGSRRWHIKGRDPAWRRARVLRNPPPDAASMGIGGGAGGGGGSRHRTKLIEQPAEGFGLGPLPEDDKRSAVTHLFAVEIEGCADVGVGVPGDAADGVTFLGLAVPVAPIVGEMRMQDGRLVAAAGGKVSVSTWAVRLDGPLPALADLPIQVDVTVPGCRPLGFKWRLGEPLPTPVFVPEAAAGKED